MPTQLSPSFTLEEMTFSQTAARMGIANRPASVRSPRFRHCVSMYCSRGEILRATFPPSGGVEYAHLTRDQASVLVA